jgi:hypothetical protein
MSVVVNVVEHYVLHDSGMYLFVFAMFQMTGNNSADQFFKPMTNLPNPVMAPAIVV